MADTSKILFVAERDADFVLVSSDNVTFPVRRVSLQANSDVFNDMFKSSSGALNEKDSETGLPLIKIGEKAEDIDFLLRLFMIKQVKSKHKVMSLEQSKSIYRIADKYGFEEIEKKALARLLVLAGQDPLPILDYSLRTRHLGLSRAALSHLTGTFSYYDVGTNAGVRRYPSGALYLLSGLALDTLETLSMKTVRSLFAHEESVLLNKAKWPDFAKTFTFE